MQVTLPMKHDHPETGSDHESPAVVLHLDIQLSEIILLTQTSIKVIDEIPT